MSPLTALPGEQLEENYNVHELPSETNEDIQESAIARSSRSEETLVSLTLFHCVEALEAENTQLMN